jgi:amino acid adenylation domain-containing protein
MRDMGKHADTGNIERRQVLEHWLLEQRRQRRKESSAMSLSPGEPVYASFGQERMWLTEQGTTDAAGNYAFSFRLRGDLNQTALQSAIRNLHARQEVLRTVLTERDTQLIQTVLPPPESPLHVVDMAGVADFDGAAREFIHAELDRRFDLSAEVPVKWHLLQADSTHHVLCLVIHHIASDGWSEAVIKRELSELYTESLQAGSPASPPPSVQYREFAAWQRRHLSGRRQEEMAYWLGNLTDAPAGLELPFDRRPSVDGDRTAATDLVTLPRGFAERVEQFSHACHASPFITLFTAFVALLHRYSGQRDLVIGTPVAGRTRPDTERLIGFFVNTLPLRIDTSDTPTFRELLLRARTTILDGFTYQDVPYGKIIEDLHPAREPGRPPLLQTTFQYDNTPTAELELPGLQVTTEQLFSKESPMELTVMVERRGSDLAGIWRYHSALFEPATMLQLQQSYAILLDHALDNPDTRVDQLPLVDDGERTRLTTRWNDTARAVPPAGVHQLFERQVERTPHATALVAGTTTMSYDELNRRANKLAHCLRARGVGPETLVGLLMDRTADLLVSVLGVLKSGGAYLPLDPAYPLGRLRRVVNEARPSVIVTQPHRSAFAAALDFPSLVVGEDAALAAAQSDNPAPLATADNLAYVIYTSGSTGVPKGVAIPHRGLTNYLTWAARSFGVDATRGAVVQSSLSFDLTVTALFLPLLQGRDVVILPNDQVLLRLADVLRKEPAEFGLVKLTPSELSALHAAFTPGDRLASMTQCVLGGEALSAEAITEWRKIAPNTRFVNEYGPTETVVGCSSYVVPSQEDMPRSPLPLGRPVDNTRMYVLDRYGEPVPDGAVGEICIGGAQVARGYLNQPGLTAEKFVPDSFGEPGDRLYRSGDLARYRHDGTLEFQGRIGTQIKVRGFRVEPAEIEDALRRHPEVRDAVVVGRDNRLIGYVAGGDAPSAAALRGFLDKLLPAHLVPTTFVILDALPLTENGKLDQSALPDPGGPGDGAEGDDTEMADPIERSVAAIWADVLGVDRVRPADDFFDLGGHSLLAVRVVARIRDEFPNAPILDVQRDLLESRTVAALADRLRAAGAPPQQARWQPAQRQPAQRADDVTPNSEVEQALTPIWASVLGREHLGVHDDFFAVGGQPHMVPDLITRMRVAFQADLPESLVSECPTVAQAAHRVEEIVMAEIDGMSDEDVRKALGA